MNILKTMAGGGIVAGLLAVVTTLPAQPIPFSQDTYSVQQTVTIDGIVVRFTYLDPYSLVYVMASGKNGTMVAWVVQWRAASALAREDINRHTLRVGDHVIVIGNPARDVRSHRMRMKAIERPADGWMWVGITSD